MRRLVAAVVVSLLGLGCGGRATKGDVITAQEPVRACFPWGPPLSVVAVQNQIQAKLGVSVPSESIDPDESDELVRGQILVEGIDSALHAAGPPGEITRLLRDFVFNQLVATPRSDGTPRPRPLGLSEPLALAMDGELDRFLSHWATEQDATLQALLTSNTTYLNAELANHYGVAVMPQAPDFEPVEQPVAARAGVLTLGAFLSRFPSPPARALQLARALTCVVPPPPPPTIDSVWDRPDRPSAKQIIVETYGDKDSPSCAACHRLYVGYAVALEHYDELGRYRDTLNGSPIDVSYSLSVAAQYPPSGELRDIEFATEQDLGQALAQTASVRGCLVEQLALKLGIPELSEHDLSCVLNKLEEKSVSFNSLLAILTPRYLTTPAGN